MSQEDYPLESCVSWVPLGGFGAPWGQAGTAWEQARYWCSAPSPILMGTMWGLRRKGVIVEKKGNIPAWRLCVVCARAVMEVEMSSLLRILLRRKCSRTTPLAQTS